ncbi:hypothetical protein [Sphingopyxis sp. MWB1]|nr:hypothetical protein [Sphingopyxis sp. MWB1]
MEPTEDKAAAAGRRREDRRQAQDPDYTGPERRSGEDRRSGGDRRSVPRA